MLKCIKALFFFFKEKKKDNFQPLTVVLDVNYFNNWFKEIYDGYGGYPGSAKGIFGRTDKLSKSMIQSYFEYYGHSDISHILLYNFEKEIINNWRKI